LSAATLVLCGGWLVVEGPAAQAANPATPSVVSPVPASYTPDVENGVVYAVNQVGSTVFLGGSFTSVESQDGSTVAPSQYLAAFTSGTGALVTSFAPQIVGTTINAIIPGPTSNTVYVGGDITSIDGVKTKVALLNATTGAIVPGWKAPALNGLVNRMVLADGQLFVGGTFTLSNASVRDGLETLNPTTGALTSYATINFTGHHSYGIRPKAASGAVGIKSLAVNAAGTQLAVVGNFTSVADPTGTYSRDQLALLNLGTSGATVNQAWQTYSYTSPCNSGAFDSYIRDVQFSPDGSYFVVVATGGLEANNSDGTRGLCDAAARFDPNATGTHVQPTWVDFTGRDSLWSVAVSSAAVYVGGHERWLNNTFGGDNAQQGAVPRPSVAALDPVNGVPLSWDPGRNPRGDGTYALFLSADGLYMGSDQDYVGNFQYLRQKIAFFPLAGGETLASNATAALPGRVYTAGAYQGSVDRLSERHFDGTTAGTEASLSTGISWGSIRGAFMLNGEVIYGKSDGKLYERSFNGDTFGAEVLLDPYDDPYWSSVDTGSGQSYRGVVPSLFGTEMQSVTSMFFTNGRLYYTLAGKTGMFWRWFEPDSGIVGPDEFTTTDTNNWSNVAGAFLSGNTLYFADKTSGQLESVPWSGTQAAGAPTVLATGQNDWASRGMFLLDDATHPNQPPVASFTPACSASSTTCTFDASTSNDPDGAITDYSWNFGDGTSQDQASSPVVSHTFPAPGSPSAASSYTVTLTVTDNDGATGTKTFQAAPDQGVPVPTFKAAVSACGSGTTTCGKSAVTNVGVPSGTAAGDTLLMFVSWPNTATSVSVPAGWHLLDKDVSSPLESDVYYRAASAADPGTTVPVTFGAATKNNVTLADYSGTDQVIEAYAKSGDSNTASHTTPNATVTDAGSLAVSYWSDKSSTTTAWSLPATVQQDSTSVDTGTAYVTTALGQSPSTVGIGSYGSQTATTNAVSGKGTEWTVILAPAGYSPNQPPVAAFTSSCTALTCTFSAGGSSDPDGSVTGYSWDFGDGSSPDLTSAPTHTYTTPGTYQVKLTVTDNDGATASVINPVSPKAPGPQIGFVGANKADASATSLSVPAPAGVGTGDALLLFESYASTTVTTSTPAGWTLVGSTKSSNLTTNVYSKAATAGDAGSSIGVGFSASVKASLVVADYRNAVLPVETDLSATAAGTTAHTAPALSGLAAGSWVVSYWTDKSTTTTSWTPPGGVTQRAVAYGTGSGADSALVADSGPVTSSPAQTATTDATSGSSAQWSLALAPTS
jgi:PKD repeat protein